MVAATPMCIAALWLVRGGMRLQERGLQARKGRTMEIAAPVRLRERCPVCGSMKLPRGMHRQDGLGKKVVGSLDRLHAMMKKRNRKSLLIKFDEAVRFDIDWLLCPW